MWKAVGRNLTFSLVESNIFVSAPASFITSNKNEIILAYLQSNFGKYFIYNNSDTTGAGDIMLNIQSIEKIPIPQNSKFNFDIKKIILKGICNETERKINTLIYKSFDFNDDEIKFIDNL